MPRYSGSIKAALAATVLGCALATHAIANGDEEASSPRLSAGPLFQNSRNDIGATNQGSIARKEPDNPEAPRLDDDRAFSILNDEGQRSDQEILPGVPRVTGFDSNPASETRGKSEPIPQPEIPWEPATVTYLGVPNLRDDIHAFPGQLWDDTKSLFTISNGLNLALDAGLTAIVAHNWDDEVRDDVAMHPRRWGGFNNVMDVVGHPLTHAGVAGGLYAVALITDNPKDHEFAKALINALILTNGTTVALKYSFDTERPNGKDHGFPSGHTSSSFAVAAVVNEFYGPTIGLGAYVTAGLVGWSRIDNRSHDLSDVLFGAALGYIIGQSVAKNHALEELDIRLAPYSDPASGTHGISVEHKY